MDLEQARLSLRSEHGVGSRSGPDRSGRSGLRPRGLRGQGRRLDSPPPAEALAVLHHLTFKDPGIPGVFLFGRKAETKAPLDGLSRPSLVPT